MVNKKYLYLISLFVILLGIIPLNIINSKQDLGIVYSIPADDPTVDGNIIDSEWTNSEAKEFTIYNHLDQNDNWTCTVKTIYSSNNNISFGIYIPDTTITVEAIIMFFRSNETNELIEFSGGNPYLVDGHDAKVVWSTNAVVDCYTDSSSFDAWYDSNHGGTHDLIGQCHVEAGSNISFELTMPFETNDLPESCDVTLHVGQKIEIFFWYISNGADYYSQVRMDDQDYDYITLNIGALPTEKINIPITIVFVSLISAILIPIFSKRKK